MKKELMEIPKRPTKKEIQKNIDKKKAIENAAKQKKKEQDHKIAIDKVARIVQKKLIGEWQDQVRVYFSHGENVDVPRVIGDLEEQGYYAADDTRTYDTEDCIVVRFEPKVNGDYKYVAMDVTGKKKTGYINAKNESLAIDKLKNSGLFPTSISRAKKFDSSRGKEKENQKPNCVVPFYGKVIRFIESVKEDW
jgi:hypothetical protein